MSITHITYPSIPALTSSSTASSTPITPITNTTSAATTPPTPLGIPSSPSFPTPSRAQSFLSKLLLPSRSPASESTASDDNSSGLSCTGPQSAHPCSSCLALVRRQRYLIRPWWKTAPTVTKAASPLPPLVQHPRPHSPSLNDEDLPDPQHGQTDAEPSKEGKGVALDLLTGDSPASKARIKDSDVDLMNAEAMAEMLAAMHLHSPTQEEPVQQENAGEEDRWCKSCFLSFPSRLSLQEHVKHSTFLHPPPSSSSAAPITTQSNSRQEGGGGERGGKVCTLCHPSRSYSVASWANHVRTTHHACSLCASPSYLGGCGILLGLPSDTAWRDHVLQWHEDQWCGVCDDFLPLTLGEQEARGAKGQHLRTQHVSCQLCLLAGDNGAGGEEGGWFASEEEKERHERSWCHFCGVGMEDGLGKRLHMRCRHRGLCEWCVLGERECAVHQAVRREEDRRKREQQLRDIVRMLWLVEGWLVVMAKLAYEGKQYRGKNSEGKHPNPGDAGTKAASEEQLEEVPELFRLFRITPQADENAIRRAVRNRRVATHPDRLERQANLTEDQKEDIREESKFVGWAGDILLNRDQRELYLAEVEWVNRIAKERQRAEERKWWWRKVSGFQLTLLTTVLGMIYVVAVAFTSGEVTLEGLLQKVVAFAGWEEDCWSRTW